MQLPLGCLLVFKGCAMNKIKLFAITGILLWSHALVHASETYTFIVPNSPGTTSDAVARLVADEYHDMTGNNMMLEYAAGADGVIGATKFKNCRSTCVTVNGVGVLVLNYFLKENLPYTRQDFDHVAWVGWVTNIWYTHPGTNIKSLDDLKNRVVKQTPTTVAHDFPASSINIVALQKEYNNYVNFARIPYKSSTQVLQDIMGGQVDLAIGSGNLGLYEQARSGKIRILGSTNPENISINGQTVPTSIGVFGNAPQFQAAQVISISPGAKSAEVEKLKRNIQAVLKQPRVVEKLQAMALVVPTGNIDGNYAREQLTIYEKQLKQIELNPKIFQ